MKDIIHKVRDAVIAFNTAKSWHEFLINIDLIGISLDELEDEYSSIMTKDDKFFASYMIERFAREDGAISFKKAFSTYVDCDFAKCHAHITLPVDIEYDNDSVFKMVKVFYANQKYVGYSYEFNIGDDPLSTSIANEVVSQVMRDIALRNSKR